MNLSNTSLEDLSLQGLEYRGKYGCGKVKGRRVEMKLSIALFCGIVGVVLGSRPCSVAIANSCKIFREA